MFFAVVVLFICLILVYKEAKKISGDAEISKDELIEGAMSLVSKMEAAVAKKENRPPAAIMEKFREFNGEVENLSYRYEDEISPVSEEIEVEEYSYDDSEYKAPARNEDVILINGKPYKPPKQKNSW